MEQALIQISIVLVWVLQHMGTMRLVVFHYIVVERVEVSLVLKLAAETHDDIIGDKLLSRFWEHIK